MDLESCRKRFSREDGEEVVWVVWARLRIWGPGGKMVNETDGPRPPCRWSRPTVSIGVRKAVIRGRVL